MTSSFALAARKASAYTVNKSDWEGWYSCKASYSPSTSYMLAEKSTPTRHTYFKNAFIATCMLHRPRYSFIVHKSLCLQSL